MMTDTKHLNEETRADLRRLATDLLAVKHSADRERRRQWLETVRRECAEHRASVKDVRQGTPS